MPVDAHHQILMLLQGHFTNYKKPVQRKLVEQYDTYRPGNIICGINSINTRMMPVAQLNLLYNFPSNVSL